MQPWKLKEQYDKQHDEHFAKANALQRKVQDAQQAVEAAKAERDNVIQRGLRGEATDEEKRAAFQAVADAEMALDIALAEQRAFLAVGQDAGITLSDLIKDWNTNYVPSVRAAELAPILERANKAKAEYYNAPRLPTAEGRVRAFL